MPTISRIKNRRQYLVLATAAAEDTSISSKARGFLVYLLAKPDDWEISIKGMAAQLQEGRDSIRAGMKELTDAGYVKAVWSRGDDGRMEGITYVLDEGRRFTEQERENPETENPVTDNPTQVIKQDNLINKELTPLPPMGESEGVKKEVEDTRFSIFWNEYPRARRQAKKVARAKWDKLKVDDVKFRIIMEALRKQKSTEQWTKDKGQFVPMPSTWLNQERWEDEVAGPGGESGWKEL